MDNDLFTVMESWT